MDNIDNIIAKLPELQKAIQEKRRCLDRAARQATSGNLLFRGLYQEAYRELLGDGQDDQRFILELARLVAGHIKRAKENNSINLSAVQMGAVTDFLAFASRPIYSDHSKRNPGLAPKINNYAGMVC